MATAIFVLAVGASPIGPVAVRAQGPGAPVPVLSSPPAGLRGFALWDSYYDLRPFGYEEEEYLVAGTAVDAGGATAPFVTRIIVTRPVAAGDFNGTVFLDWVNVTAQFENAVDTMLARPFLMREGYAYVHLSVQSAGLCCTPLTPKVWDPVRYASLAHPGDAFAFDLLTQVARSFRSAGPAGSLDPMGDLGIGAVERVLVAGQSQSGIRLADYVETWLPAHPGAVGAIDGILVHGNVPGEKAFAAASPVPVLQLLSDLEALDDGIDPPTLGAHHRLWEVAGAAHSDLFIGGQSIFGHGPRVTAVAPKVDRAGYQRIIAQVGNYGEQLDPLLAVCTAAGATLPMRYATSAAIHQLDRWAAGAGPPDHGPRYTFAGGLLARDADGNALGGIRLPPIEVPLARYESTACGLGGITVPFTDLQIQERHGTHGKYLAAMAAASDRAVAAGFLLPDDAVDQMARACAAGNRFGIIGPPSCPAYLPPAFDIPLSAAPGVGGGGTSAAGGTSGAGVAEGRATAGSLPATGQAGPPTLVAAVVLTALVLRRSRVTGS